MANNSALKLVVDTSEYDANIKKAAEGIQHLAKRVHDAGGFFDYFDKATMDFVKGLEDMSTAAVTSAGQYRELENAYKGLAATYNGLDPFEKQGEAGRELANQLGILKDRVLEAKANFEDASKSLEMPKIESTKSQLRDLTKELTDITVAYRALSDEERQSPIGQEMAQKIQQMTEKAGVMRDAMADVQASIKNSASDTRVFDQIAGGAQMMTAGFQSAVGAMKLFGVETDNNVEVLAQLQAAMGVVNGLQTIQTALQKQSAVMQGVQAVQAAAAAAAQTSLAGATGAATVAQKAFNMVANANPYVLLATAVAAVGTALYAFASASSKAKQEAEEMAKAEEEAAKKSEDARNAFVNAAAEAMNSASRLSSLQAAYKNANSEIEKTNILKQAQQEFKKLGIECKGVNDAQTLLIKNGSKVIELIQLQGNVAAVSAVRMEKFKESFKMLMENGYSASAAASLAGYNKEVQELDGQITTMQGKIQNLKGGLGIGKGSGGGSRKSTKIENEDDKFAADSIMAQEKWIAKLEDDWKRAGASVRDEYIPMIEMAKKKLEEMKGVAAAEVDLDKMFPDMSKENYDTGETQSFAQTILGDAAMSEIAAQKDALAATLTEVVKSGVDGADFTEAANALYAALFDPEAGAEEVAEAIAEMNELIPDEDKKIVLDVDTGQIITATKKVDKDVKAIAASAQAVSTVVGSIGQAFNAIEDPAAKVMGTVMQAIATVAGGYATASAQAAALGPWAWIAFAATGLATMLNMINTIHSSTGYANGGIVGGNSYSGDNLRTADYGINSGELVLNRAQQGNLASQLEDGATAAENTQPFVNGEMIYLGLQAYMRRSGLGEIVTSER